MNNIEISILCHFMHTARCSLRCARSNRKCFSSYFQGIFYFLMHIQAHTSIHEAMESGYPVCVRSLRCVSMVFVSCCLSHLIEIEIYFPSSFGSGRFFFYTDRLTRCCHYCERDGRAHAQPLHFSSPLLGCIIKMNRN